MKNKKLDKLINNLVKESFKLGKLDNAFVKVAIKTLTKLNSTEAIYALSKYQKGLERKLEETTMVLESYEKLSKGDVAKIKTTLNKKYKIQNTTLLINPGVLGGIRIKIGDYLMDYSLKNNIKQLGDKIRGRE